MPDYIGEVPYKLGLVVKEVEATLKILNAFHGGNDEPLGFEGGGEELLEALEKVAVLESLIAEGDEDLVVLELPLEKHVIRRVGLQVVDDLPFEEDL